RHLLSSVRFHRPPRPELYTLSLHDALPISDQEAARAAVAGGPGQVADALEAEHRIEDVERQHRLVVGAVGGGGGDPADAAVLHRSEEHTSELQSRENLVCRLLLEKKKKTSP